MDVEPAVGTTPTPADAAPVDVEVVRGAVTRVSLLAQVLSGATTGDPEAYADAFADTLRESLDRPGVRIRIDLDGSHLSYAGAQVSANDLVTQSIVEGLSAEGFETLTLISGATREELIELVHLLAATRDTGATSAARSRLEARMWALDLPHVHLEVSPRSVVTEADSSRVRGPEMVARAMDHLGLSRDSLGDGATVELGALLGGLRALSGSPAAPTVDTPVTARAWSRALQSLNRKDDVPDAIVGLSLREALRSAESEDACAALVAAARDHAIRSIAHSDTDRAEAIFTELAQATDERHPVSGVEATAVYAGLARAPEASLSSALQAGLARRPGTDDWVPLLFTLPRSTHPDHLATLASHVGRARLPDRLTQAAADGLLSACRRHGLELRNLLASADDDALPVLLRAARHLQDPTLIEPLLGRASHGDPTVRAAALLALRRHQSPRIKASARAAIDDDHRTVRLEALRYVAVYRDADAAAPIGARLTRLRAEQADAEELRALAIAWVHTSHGAAIAELEALAAGKPTHPDLPQAILAAFQRLGDPGKAARERLGRSHPHLRPLLRGTVPSEAP